MDIDKQILKEIAKDLCKNSMCKLDEWSNCDLFDGCYCSQCLNLALNLYNIGYRKQEWISVEDRLPEKNVRVLVCIKSNRSYTRFDTDRLDDRGFVRWFNDVTHWMPLPEAPKMKGGAE